MAHESLPGDRKSPDYEGSVPRVPDRSCFSYCLVQAVQMRFVSHRREKSPDGKVLLLVLRRIFPSGLFALMPASVVPRGAEERSIADDRSEDGKHH